MKRLTITILIIAVFTGAIAAYALGGDAHSGIITATPIPASLVPGERFDMTIGISDNPGFAAMLIRISIPQGLALIDYHAYLPYAEDFITSIENDTPLPITGGYLVAGWTGRTENIYTNGSLFTLTFQATIDTPHIHTASIQIAFADRHAYDLPTDATENNLTIALPGGITGIGQSAKIGTIALKRPSISINPRYTTIKNQDGYEVRLEITIENLNLPPGEKIYFNCEEHSTIKIDVDIEGAQGIRISGHAQTDNQGITRGNLILTVDGEITTDQLTTLARALTTLFD